MVLEDSAKLSLLIDGEFQVTTQNISAKNEFGNVPIQTLLGLSGFGETGGSVAISFTGYIPTSGLEFNAWNAGVNREYHTIEIPVGSETYLGNGKFTSCDIQYSTDGIATIAAEWMGEQAEME